MRWSDIENILLVDLMIERKSFVSGLLSERQTLQTQWRLPDVDPGKVDAASTSALSPDLLSTRNGSTLAPKTALAFRKRSVVLLSLLP